MKKIKEVFECLFIPILICYIILAVAYNTDSEIENSKQQIINNCEQRFIGDYSQIKACVDFELNYKR